MHVRDAEFAERGPLPCRVLARRLESTVREALGVLRRLRPAAHTRRYVSQGFHVTGLYAVFHVAEHFPQHAGQIIYIAKMKRSRDLGFTKLPVASKHLYQICDGSPRRVLLEDRVSRFCADSFGRYRLL